MKKLKIASLSPSPLVLIMAIAALIAVPVRTFQLTNCVEPSTGFWLVKDFTVPFLYALCIVVIVLAFFMSFFSGIMTKPVFAEKKDIPIGVFASLFAVSLIVDSVFRTTELITIFDEYAIDGSNTFLSYILQSGGVFVILQVLFGVFSAVYMALVGVSYFKGNGVFKKNALLALSLPIWSMSRVAYHFVDPINYKNVSQLLFQLIMLIFVVMFTLSFGRIASSVNSESSMWLLWFSGISGAFIGFICGLAPIILLIIGKSDYIPVNYPVRYSDLGFSMFATAFLFSVMPRTIKAEK